MKLFSVIISAYNAAGTLPEAIDSILSQTYRDFELIIVNDGSRDETGAIIDSYASKDSRITAYHQENKGLGKSFNLAIEMADGEWLAFLGADDAWMRRKLELQLRAIEEHPDATVVATGWTNYDDGVARDESVELNLLPIKRLQNIFETLVLNDFQFPPASALLKREKLRKVGLFTDDKSGQDYRPFMLLALQDEPFYLLDMPLYRMRIVKGSLSRSANSGYKWGLARFNAIRDVLEHQDLYRQYLDPERIEILKWGVDKYLKGAISGARQSMTYNRYFAFTIENLSNFSRWDIAIKELCKSLLFPGAKMLRLMKPRSSGC